MKINVSCRKCGRNDIRIRTSGEVTGTSGESWGICNYCLSKMKVQWAVSEFYEAFHNKIDPKDWQSESYGQQENLFKEE